MKNSNRVVVDLNKCQHARLFYRNQYGDNRNLPLKHSYRGQKYNPDEPALAWFEEPRETLEQRAVRNNIKDIWTPVCYLKLTANNYLIYHGDKAISIYKEWCRRIFKKGNKT